MAKTETKPAVTKGELVLQSLEDLHQRISGLQTMIRNREDSAAILNNTAVLAQTITSIHSELVRACLEEALTRRGSAPASTGDLERLITEIAKSVR